ncbi:alpha/beta hydrolase-fold protein [Agaribacter flavus]|uniref:Alpha/beta hydrolase-fold protein n=1 Tax=Agaribacter flavus TaxID=1902781 RepID=A0ABV7FM05_9ALTE
MNLLSRHFVHKCLLFFTSFLLFACGGSSGSTDQLEQPAPTPSPPSAPPLETPEVRVELESWTNTGGTYDGFGRYDLSNGGAINFNQAGDFGEYEVELQKGQYRVVLEASTPIIKTPTQVQLHINDCLVTTANVRGTESWNLFEDNLVTDELVVNTSGKHTLKVIGWGEAGTWQWNADRLVITRLGDSPSAPPSCVEPPALPPKVPTVEEGYDYGEIVTGFSISPSQYSASYAYQVYIPHTYNMDTNKGFDLIIVTDAEWHFDSFVRNVDRQQRQLIVVGLENSGRRNTDFRLPFAPTYIDFLSDEFLPQVLNAYRVKQDNITLEGFSFGGLMVGLALLLDDTEQPKFKNLLSVDGAFWDRSSEINTLLQQRHASNEALNVKAVFVGASTQQGNGTVVRSFANSLRQAGFMGVDIQELYYDVPHEQAVDISINESLNTIYGSGGPE